jgi:hypothetical protein
MRKLAEKPSDDTTKLPRVRPSFHLVLLSCLVIYRTVELTSAWLIIPQAQAENDEAEAVYEILNGALLEGLPQLVELRVPYLDPSFEAMVRCQLRFAEEGYEKMSGVQR